MISSGKASPMMHIHFERSNILHGIQIDDLGMENLSPHLILVNQSPTS